MLVACPLSSSTLVIYSHYAHIQWVEFGVQAPFSDILPFQNSIPYNSLRNRILERKLTNYHIRVLVWWRKKVQFLQLSSYALGSVTSPGTVKAGVVTISIVLISYGFYFRHSSFMVHVSWRRRSSAYDKSTRTKSRHFVRQSQRIFFTRWQRLRPAEVWQPRCENLDFSKNHRPL